jgi:hypothetical protein
MSQQITIERDLQFKGVANQTNNVIGNFNMDKRLTEWNFMEKALDTTNQYTQNLDTTSTIANGSAGCVFTTAATDNKVATMSFGGVLVLCASNPIVEMRFQVNDITNLAIFAGLSDANTEAAATMPFSLALATLTDNCNNGVGFLYDTDQTHYWNIVNTKAGTQAFTQLGPNFAPVNATDVVLRTALDTTGKAYFFYNGIQVGIKANAVTAATALIPFFGIKNMSGSSHVAILKYVRLWRDM